MTVKGVEVSKIGPGMVILFGIGLDDTMDMVALAVNKILNLRLWSSLQPKEDVATKEKIQKTRK